MNKAVATLVYKSVYGHVYLYHESYGKCRFNFIKETAKLSVVSLTPAMYGNSSWPTFCHHLKLSLFLAILMGDVSLDV